MKKITPLGISGFILSILAICFFMISFFIWSSFGLIIFILALVCGIVSIIFGAIAFFGKWKDLLGLTGFIIGLIVVVIWAISLVFIYIFSATQTMYGTPLHRPKVK